MTPAALPAPDSRLRPLSRRALWALGIGVWTALTLLSASQRALWLAYRGEPVDWAGLLAYRFVDWYSCALFIPAFVWLVRRYPLERRRWAGRAALYVAVTAVAAVAKYAAFLPLQRGLFRMDGSLRAALAADAISEMMIFWAVIGVLHAVEFHHRYREREARALQLEAQLSDAQLRALRAQLHPHFLFNTLNAITTLIHRDPDAADTMVTRLGELLRLALRADPSHETTLGEEVALLEHYLAIMRVRFADQLSVTCTVPPGLKGALVPSFVLQPLVENALEHGVARLDGPGRVAIEAEQAGDTLAITVTDNGMLADRPLRGRERPDDGSDGGIGLANTRQRLEALYGARGQLELRPAPGGGTQARLTVPLRLAAARATPIATAGAATASAASPALPEASTAPAAHTAGV